jgi:5-methylcytosine-specific restriction protein A
MTMAWSSSDRRAQLPSNWQRVVRPRILRRDGYRCTWVDHGHRCTARATEVDHRRRGDDHRDSNLRSLCGPHHAKKSSAEGVAARRTGRPVRQPARRPAEPHPGLKATG